MSEPNLTIWSCNGSRVITREEANNTELTANYLFEKTRDVMWKKIGDYAYDLSVGKSNGPETMYVPLYIYNMFPLRDHKEYAC